MATSQGYKCEFMDSVFDDLYCNKCTLVARRLTVTICCGESFCKECIVDLKEQGKPCPECGEKDFTTFDQVKNQKRINCLQVYCSMKERGCGWSGTLEQLDTHLDPDQDMWTPSVPSNVSRPSPKTRSSSTWLNTVPRGPMSASIATSKPSTRRWWTNTCQSASMSPCSAPICVG